MRRGDVLGEQPQSLFALIVEPQVQFPPWLVLLRSLSLKVSLTVAHPELVRIFSEPLEAGNFVHQRKYFRACAINTSIMLKVNQNCCYYRNCCVFRIILARACVKIKILYYIITYTTINLISQAYLVALLNAVELLWCASLQHRLQDLKWNSTHLGDG